MLNYENTIQQSVVEMHAFFYFFYWRINGYLKFCMFLAWTISIRNLHSKVDKLRISPFSDFHCLLLPALIIKPLTWAKVDYFPKLSVQIQATHTEKAQKYLQNITTKASKLIKQPIRLWFWLLSTLLANQRGQNWEWGVIYKLHN